MQTNLRISKLFLAVAVALVATAGLAALAFAAETEQTLETYVAKVEPICKTNTKANERILSGITKKIKQGELKYAAGKFAQASAAFGKAVKQIEAVPQPVADEAKLTKWLGYLDKERKLLGEISTALKAGKKGRVQTLSVLLNHNGEQANNTVVGLGFNYCLIKQSRFS
jgi:hypothetical protein